MKKIIYISGLLDTESLLPKTILCRTYGKTISQSVKALNKMIREHKPDILISHSSGSEVVLRAKIDSVPLVALWSPSYFHPQDVSSTLPVLDADTLLWGKIKIKKSLAKELDSLDTGTLLPIKSKNVRIWLSSEDSQEWYATDVPITQVYYKHNYTEKESKELLAALL